MPDPGAGHAAYSPAVLRAYDAWVLGVSNRFAWRCPTRHLLAWYDRHAGDAHLDAGPGTGWFLRRCRFPGAAPALTLLDANPTCLRTAARRLKRYRPATVQADLLTDLPSHPDLPRNHFASAGLNYVLHCLPGGLPTKAAVLDRLIPLLREGGVLFGSTILGDAAGHNAFGRKLMRIYNARGIFGNADDTIDDLRDALHARLDAVDIKVTGVVARFAGRRRRSL